MIPHQNQLILRENLLRKERILCEISRRVGCSVRSAPVVHARTLAGHWPGC